VWDSIEVANEGPDGLAVASRGQRRLAALVNAGVGIAALVVIGCGAAATAGVRRRRHRGSPLDPKSVAAWSDWLTRHRSELAVYSLWCAIAFRNHRSPGDRLLGLRRVDARSGRAVDIPSALITHVLSSAWTGLANQICEPARKRSHGKMEALQPELQRIQRELSGDARRQQEALMAFYEASDVNPLASCGWFLPQMLIGMLPRLRLKDGRNMFERLAGTVVIVEPRPGTTD
jgi:hypothetical protein